MAAGDEPLQSGRGYPRPQLRRDAWSSLNGEWDFAIDESGRWCEPHDVTWTGRIRVPFSPEAPLSGVHRTGFFRACWYRRVFEVRQLLPGQRILVHFGAVDYTATVWCNGQFAGGHEGGYSPFTVDVTGCRGEPGRYELIVRAGDDPLDLAKPRGKQDWQLTPHSIWYPRTSGIWQSVWLELVPAVHIAALRWTPNLSDWEIGFSAWLSPDDVEGLRIRVHLRAGDHEIADDTVNVIRGEVHRGISLSDPGIDDSRNELLWSPETPTLVEAELELWGERGERLDHVHSYTALRSVSAQRDRFLLNGRPYQMRLVLDQGYWPDGGMTAPDDAALRRDVELAKAMGFNGVRKHQKLEDPRYLYWADRLGLLVWTEMPSAYRFTPNSVERCTRQWTEAVHRDTSHPCVAAWVPFNESWGVPNLPYSERERHYVQGLYHLTKTLDPTRPVIGNDGWESVATDIVGIHDYDSDLDRIARRYHADTPLLGLFRRARPGGRLIVLDENPQTELPIVLSEFGGIACSSDPASWGYSRSGSPAQLAQQYAQLMQLIHGLSVFSGFCYTQFADTYQEANGLLYADRTPKFPLHEIAQATRGRDPRDRPSSPSPSATVSAPEPGA